MAESSTPLPGGAPGAKDELALLEILQLLISTKKARTTADLLKYATQYGAPEAEERLRVFEAEGIPIDLAFDAVSAQLRILAHKRNSSLVAGCREKKSRPHPAAATACACAFYAGGAARIPPAGRNFGAWRTA